MWHSIDDNIDNWLQIDMAHAYWVYFVSVVHRTDFWAQMGARFVDYQVLSTPHEGGNFFLLVTAFVVSFPGPHRQSKYISECCPKNVKPESYLWLNANYIH